MAVTDIDICNRALALLGHDRTISSLADGSAEAARCALFYPAAKLNVLAAQAWEFAIRQIAVEGGAAASLPEDCARLVSISDDAGGAISAVRSGRSVTPARDGTLRYVSSATPVGDMPHLVVEAIVAELAFQLYGPMLGNPSGEPQMAAQKGLSALAQAKIQAAWDAELAEHSFAGAPADADSVARLDVANRALALAGSAAVVYDLARDPSPEAVRCRQFLPMAVRSVLASHAWGFATVRRSASHTPPDQDGYVRIHTPPDMARLVEVDAGEGRPLPRRAANGDVFVKALPGTPVRLSYVSSDVDLSLAPGPFVDAVAYRLASLIAPALSPDTATARGVLQLAEAKVAEAKSVEARDADQPGEWENPFVAARR